VWQDASVGGLRRLDRGNVTLSQQQQTPDPLKLLAPEIVFGGVEARFTLRQKCAILKTLFDNI
jgi:hypothetical protein